MKTLVIGGVLLALGLVLSVILWSSASRRERAQDENRFAALEAARLVTPKPGPTEAPPSVLDPILDTDPTRAEAPVDPLSAALVKVASSEISGRVQPVAGCMDDEVEVYACSASLGGFALNDILDSEAHNTERDRRVVARAKVDTDGTFRLTLPGGMERLWLHARGRYAFTAQPLELEVKAAAPIVLLPTCGACIEGRILAPEGSGPITESVKIEILAALDARVTGAGQQDRQRETWSENGAFKFRAVAVAATYEVELTAEQYPALQSSIAGLTAGRTQDVVLQLVRGGTLRGRVVDTTGAAVADAEVRALRPGRWFGFDSRAVRKRTSAADGTFELPAVGVGAMHVSAEKKGLLAEKPLEVNVVDGGTVTDLVVELGVGGTVAGSVTWSDGSPAVDISVNVEFDPAQMFGMTALNAARGARGEAKTDANGQFTVTGLGPGPFLVSAEALPPGDEGAADEKPAERKRRMHRARTADVKPGTENLKLTLAPAKIVRGRVVDAASAPIAVYRLNARSVGTGLIKELGQESFDTDVADEQGAFTVALPRDGTWMLTASAETYANSDAFELELPRPEEPAEIVITLQKAATVRGTVVDPRGVLVAGASVEISTGEPAWQRNLSQVLRAKADTKPDGSFTLSGLKPARLKLFATAKQYAKSTETAVDLTNGGELAGVIVTLRDGGRLTGEVYEAGKPAASMLIQATLISTYDQAVGFSDMNGRFELEHLEPGSYQIVAMRTGALASDEDATKMDAASIMSKIKMASAEIVDGQDTHVVLGAPPADPVHVHGRVTHVGGSMAGAMVVFIGESKDVLAGMKTASVGADGEYALDLDAPGNYVVTVQRLSGKPGEQSSVEFARTIPTVKDHRLDLAMPNGRISGRVTRPDGTPAADVPITLATEQGVQLGSLFGGQFVLGSTDGEGRFDLTAIKPGVYALSAGGSLFGGLLGTSAEFGRMTIKNVRVKEGEWRKNVDVRLEKPGEVLVTVVGADGQPVAGADIFARDENGHVLEAMSMYMTGPDGTVRYSGLTPGKYTFSARLQLSAGADSAPVTVAAGEVKTVRIAVADATMLIVKVVDGDDHPVAAWLTIFDSAGREVGNMIGMRELQKRFTGSSTSRDEQRLGPFVPGKYRVRAERADGKSVEKPVNLSGQAERTLKLTFD